jgi:hypothetical protein
MKKITGKRLDFAQRANAVVEAATNEQDEPPAKESIAVESGRRGGKVGGKARAEKLTADERKAIAQKSAQARWQK